jgi:hypothetical protein
MSVIVTLRVLLLGAGFAGGALLIAADFSSLYSVTVLAVTKSTIVGHDQHDYALLLVGLAALVLGVLAGGGSRVAMCGLVALGAIGLGIGAIGDAHDVSSPGVIGELYAGAAAHAHAGFYLETAGATLLLVAGAGQLILSLPAGRAPARHA